MANTKDIPARVKKLIIQESGGVCAFCREDDVSTLEFHHIHGRDIPKPHAPENLIYICKNCHGKITAGVISLADVDLKKRELQYREKPFPVKSTGGRTNVINIKGVNKGTIANVIHIHGKTARQPKNVQLEGSIGSDLLKRNYLKHLIDRYHEFARAEKGSDYKYPVFYGAIKRKYGTKWDNIPSSLFEDVCQYVQGRIDRTIVGKNHKARGESNYSAFKAYCDKYAKG